MSRAGKIGQLCGEIVAGIVALAIIIAACGGLVRVVHWAAGR
jgi:hypothetical protein